MSRIPKVSAATGSDRLAALYLIAQAIAFAAWWAVLVARPSTRAMFAMPGAPDRALLAFSLADGAVVAASVAAAVGLMRARAWARRLTAAVAGAVVYAALYCVVVWLDTGGAGWSVVAMAPAAAASTFVAVRA